MNLHREFNCDCDFDGSGLCSDFSGENKKEAVYQRAIRKKLEDKLENKRLLEELGDLGDEFDWDEIDKIRS